MRYKRAVVEVSMRLDGVPGWNHEPEDLVKLLQDTLPSWYYPKVKLLRVEDEPAEETERIWKESQEASK